MRCNIEVLCIGVRVQMGTNKASGTRNTVRDMFESGVLPYCEALLIKHD